MRRALGWFIMFVSACSLPFGLEAWLGSSSRQLSHRTSRSDGPSSASCSRLPNQSEVAEAMQGQIVLGVLCFAG